MSVDQQLIERVRRINSNLDIRPAVESDAEKFIALMNSQYQKKRTTAYYYWQFFSSALPTRLFLAYDKDSLAACYGVQIGTLSNGQTCAQAIDLVVAEQYRLRGLFLLLELEASTFASEHNCIAMVCLPNRLGMKAHAAIADWHSLGPIPTMELRKTSQSDSAIVIQQQLSADTSLSFFKDDIYRSWRYDHNPQSQYEYVRLSCGDFATVKLFVDPLDGTRFGDIVEFNCGVLAPSRFQLLFDTAINYLFNLDAEIVTTWTLPHMPHYRLLKARGFIDTSLERYFCVKVLDSKYRHLYNLNQWNLMESDSELY